MLPLMFTKGQKGKPIDSNATTETVNLYENLGKLSKNHTLFGHQHATEYGHGWSGDTDRYDIPMAAKKLKIVSDYYALKAGNLAAFTETGLESIPNPDWWTETLLKTMRTSDMQLCYVLVWRNNMRSPTHYYAPFPGQVSVPDFMKFYDDPYTLFEMDLKNIYKK